MPPVPTGPHHGSIHAGQVAPEFANGRAATAAKSGATRRGAEMTTRRQLPSPSKYGPRGGRRAPIACHPELDAGWAGDVDRYMVSCPARATAPHLEPHHGTARYRYR